MVKEHNQLFMYLMTVLDLAVTASAWLISFYLRFHTNLFRHEAKVRDPAVYISQVTVVSLLLTLLVFSKMGMYRPRRIQSLAAEVWDIIKACAAVGLLEVAASYYLYEPRLSVLMQTQFLVLWPLLLIGYRLPLRLWLRSMRKRGANLRRVAIVGAGRLGQKLLQTLRRQKWTGYHISYFVEDQHVGKQFLDLPVYGPISQVDEVVAQHPVDAVFVALPASRSDELADVLGKLSGEVVDINVVPDLLSYPFLHHQVQQVGQLAVVNLTDSPQGGLAGLGKRMIDIVLSVVGLVALSPFLLLLAAGVKLTSRGPVFYVQRRASLGGREFPILKFRSMVVDAEVNGAAWGAEHQDPRVTTLGRIMRKLSLDELPQLLNILKGDMSLVGPRPERPEFIRRFSRQVPRYMLRHHVKAGLTGWAQIHGFRGRTSLRKRIQYDLDYINRWSLGLDLWIILLTLFRGFYNPKD